MKRLARRLTVTWATSAATSGHADAARGAGAVLGIGAGWAQLGARGSLRPAGPGAAWRAWAAGDAGCAGGLGVAVLAARAFVSLVARGAARPLGTALAHHLLDVVAVAALGARVAVLSRGPGRAVLARVAWLAVHARVAGLAVGALQTLRSCNKTLSLMDFGKLASTKAYPEDREDPAVRRDRWGR